MNHTEPTSPVQMHTVTPHLICDGASAAIDFYVKAFGAAELMRLPSPQEGKLMHAGIRIGDSMIMLADEHPECDSRGPRSLQGTPVTLHLQVEDADALFARAVEAGAEVIMPVTDMFWGDRYGVVQDPFGHRWSIATQVRELSPDEILEASKTAFCGDCES